MKLKKYLVIGENLETGKDELLFETDDGTAAEMQLYIEIGRGVSECYVVSDYGEDYYKELVKMEA